MKVHIIQLPDRYIIVSDESCEEIDADSVGFSNESAAKEHAENQGWEILP